MNYNTKFYTNPVIIVVASVYSLLKWFRERGALRTFFIPLGAITTKLNNKIKGYVGKKEIMEKVGKSMENQLMIVVVILFLMIVIKKSN